MEPGVDEVEGLKEILNKRLGPEDPSEWDSKNDWTIGECLSTWWRPNYENYMASCLLFLYIVLTLFSFFFVNSIHISQLMLPVQKKKNRSI